MAKLKKIGENFIDRMDYAVHSSEVLDALLANPDDMEAAARSLEQKLGQQASFEGNPEAIVARFRAKYIDKKG